ncbi:hypothetical protein THAOC_06062 [Thalassiosira oceanica]|uniref:Metallo-beta-lactamase domain-containing protein n=1 Tax=Thalassiosira oceanica TaxID=159749 RepID=K0TFN6_THAOC|nr:hypothetical protein THAOC_06062 [Thalassiosira oceanica]|eukprot:EJK72411.1 hypothetical protein THAOC_06062 [Thalassiosira oceanica]
MRAEKRRDETVRLVLAACNGRPETKKGAQNAYPTRGNRWLQDWSGSKLCVSCRPDREKLPSRERKASSPRHANDSGNLFCQVATANSPCILGNGGNGGHDVPAAFPEVAERKRKASPDASDSIARGGEPNLDEQSSRSVNDASKKQKVVEDEFEEELDASPESENNGSWDGRKPKVSLDGKSECGDDRNSLEDELDQTRDESRSDDSDDDSEVDLSAANEADFRDDDSRFSESDSDDAPDDRHSGRDIADGDGAAAHRMPIDNREPEAAPEVDRDAPRRKAVGGNICYICGADLTRIKTGLRGRVAHMKRCSAKHGREVMDREGTSCSADVIVVDSEDDSDREEDMCGEWHGNAKGDTTSAGNNTKTKQTGLMNFFTKPVKCLTDVLMTGAKQMSKKKATLEKNKLENSKKSGKRRRGQWRSNNSQRGECPAFKRITGTDFICDGFYYSSPNLSSNYFLTHFHSDHYGGITKNWNHGTIYCSLPTANLVHRQLGVEKRFLHPLPMNTPFVVVSEKGGKHVPVTVTLLDANHCPGAIMFLFEVGNRRILHVGDFRWNNELHMRMPQLRSLGCGSPRLDELYLDTTYCAEKYTLPTQAEAIDAAIEVATKEVNYSKKNASNKTLFLFGAYTIGKERIYLLVCGRAFQNEGVRNMPVGSPARVSQSRSNAGIPGRVEQNEGVHGPVPTRGRIQAHWVDVQAQVEG